MKLLENNAPPERIATGWFLLAAALLFAALAAPFFAGRVYVADDLGEFHLPVRDFYARQLARGESFDWMPSLYGGFYLTGEGQLGGYHPWHWLLYRTLPLGAAFNIELLASYPFLLLGTYLLLRRLLGRNDAALVGATAFTFSGFALLHFIHPNAIAVVAHLPWLLWTIDIALNAGLRRQRAAATIAIGLLTASQLLLGYPQYVWFSLLAEAGFIVYLTIVRGTCARALAGTALAIVAGMLLGAPQWVPTWHLLRESVRHAHDSNFANTGSLHPLNLVQLIAPYLFEKRVVGQNTHELGLYPGAVPLVLIVWLLARRAQWGPYRPLVRALLIGTAVTLLLAMGEFGGLYHLQAWLPLVNRFRFPCRAIVLVQFCLTALAAASAALLFANRQRGASTSGESPPAALRLLMLLTVGLATAGPILWPQHVARLPLVWLGPALIAAAVAAVTLVERRARGAVAMLALLMAADLGVYGLSYSIADRTAALHDYVAAIPTPPEFAGERVAAPDAPSKLRTGDRMLLAGVNRIDGYAGLEPSKQLDYADPRIQAIAGAGWQLAAAASDTRSPKLWRRITPTVPRARLITRSLPQNELQRVAGFSWNEAVCQPELELPPSEPGSARVVADRPGSIAIAVHAPTRQVLATTESFDPGWTASSDGRPVPIVRVNGDFLGCAVAPGEHLVQLEFRPSAKRVGGQLAGLGLGLLAVAAVVTAAGTSRLARPEELCRVPN